jgi:hypothetical protein
MEVRGETEKAREKFDLAVDSAKTFPDYRCRESRHWVKLAQREI